MRLTLATRMALSAAISGLLAGCGVNEMGTETEGRPQQVATKVVRVIDGDTVVVAPVAGALEATADAPDEHVVRLLGIDAPEMNYGKDTPPECGAQASTDHLDAELPPGASVVLEYDLQADRTDRYGRSLAYVTRGSTDVAREQVAEGYAMPWYPESEPEPARVPRYSAAADRAVAGKVGGHATCESIGRD